VQFPQAKHSGQRYPKLTSQIKEEMEQTKADAADLNFCQPGIEQERQWLHEEWLHNLSWKASQDVAKLGASLTDLALAATN
jgi:hypothetical protein